MTTAFSTNRSDDRDITLVNVKNAPVFDVVVIGAGINGAGLFRELCLQGLKVLIVDRKDICAGASSAPSRLIHGGIKYLETGEFRLVAQSTLERNLLLRNAPHYVRPLPTVLPIHSWFGGIIPSARKFLHLGGKLTDRGVAILEIGLQIYDFLGRRANVMPRHTLTIGKKARTEWPSMDPTIVATGRYYDAAISQPERLGVEIIIDGLDASPHSAALTYVAPQKLDNGEVTLRDLETSEDFKVHAKLVVNAGGAWIDTVNSALGLKTRYIGGTKGSHLVIRNPTLYRELNGQMVYFGTPDGRICLAYPFFGNILVGSTDIRIENADEAICSDDEEDYMLKMLSGLFPALTFDKSDVLYRYCGVRPLPATNADDPGAISRDHIIHTDTVGFTPILSLVGGKWTTFRGLSEEVADVVLKTLKKKRSSSTRDVAIGGGRAYPDSDNARATYIMTISKNFMISPERARTLFERYGTRASDVAAFCLEEHDTPLETLDGFTKRELLFIATHEKVVHLSDIIYRRTSIALGGHVTQAVVDELAKTIGPSMGWDESRTQHEAEAAWSEAITQHNVSP